MENAVMTNSVSALSLSRDSTMHCMLCALKVGISANAEWEPKRALARYPSYCLPFSFLNPR